MAQTEAQKRAQKKYRERNKEKLKEANKLSRKKNYPRYIETLTRWRQNNPDKFKAINSRSEAKNKERVMFEDAKHRAKVKNIPFDIELSDIVIPELCPALGIPLYRAPRKGTRTNSPSLDRFIPEKGYIKGNIYVISAKANRIKSNATADEVRKVADWMESVVGS